MEMQTLIRTSAIIYADEVNSKTTNTIRKKFIESVFVCNENSPLTIDSLVDEIENSFKLTFTNEELINIINKNDVFETNQLSQQVSLSRKRFSFLKEKESFTIEDCINKFIQEDGLSASESEVNAVLMRYLYTLLNTNMRLYSNIIKPSSTTFINGVASDNKQFSEDEVVIINSFLSWENEKKNELLFKLISFSIEYSLVINHSSDTIFLNSLKNKRFYLDNNVVYRALGINGDMRKKRTDVFLQKCVENGQKLFISRFSKQEFSTTIDYHINQLKRVPFGKINPKLFRQCHCNAGFYEFYHKWRSGRISYGFDSFKAHLLGLYDSLLKRFSIEEDYKIPFNINIPNIEEYKKEIAAIKYDAHEESNKIDALNLYLVEQKRGDNNIGIQDTKYYLITTDQKLRQWDETHSQQQPLTLLPSHWMGLLIKYVSRTSDDFASFVSFLRLPHYDALLGDSELQNIVAGVSEITEDFKMQETVMQRMIEEKFNGVINGQNDPVKMVVRAKEYAKDVVESELKKQIEQKESEKLDITQSHLRQIGEVEVKYQQEMEQFKSEQEKEKLENIQTEISKITKRKTKADSKIENKIKTEIAISTVLFVLYYIALAIITWKIGWDTMEPITYFLSLGGLFGSYVFLAIKGHSIKPIDFFNIYRRRQIENTIYLEYDVSISELNELKSMVEL